MGGPREGAVGPHAASPGWLICLSIKRLRDVGRLMVSNGKSSVLSPEKEKIVKLCAPRSAGPWGASAAPLTRLGKAHPPHAHQPGSCSFGRRTGF